MHMFGGDIIRNNRFFFLRLIFLRDACFSFLLVGIGIQNVAGFFNFFGEDRIVFDEFYHIRAQVMIHGLGYGGIFPPIVHHRDFFPGVYFYGSGLPVRILVGRHGGPLQHDQLGEVAGITIRQRTVQQLPEARVGFEQGFVDFFLGAVKG